MASHHHHHHHLHHHQQQLLNGASNCCCSSCCNPPSPQPTEPLLQAIVSQLLQQQQQQQQTGVYCQAQSLKTHQNQNFLPKNSSFQHHHQQKFILSSLLSRIDALEASLQNFSLSSTSSLSLRDMAARVIQTHFRAFLVRRSRTLGQLKELALIKSSFNSLKLSVSKKPHFDFHVASQKAMDLLLKLDSIQGGDPMIRDGKKSISKDLIKFLEFVDGYAVKRYEISCKAAKDGRLVGNSSKPRVLRTNGGDFSRDQAEVMSKLRNRIEKIHGFSRVIKSEEGEDVELEGFNEFLDHEEEELNPRAYINKNGVLVKRHAVAQPRVKKTVTFTENGNVYRFPGNGDGKPNGSISSGDGASIDESVLGEDNGQDVEVEEIKVLPKETEDDEEVLSENGGSLHSSDGERNPRGSMRTQGGYGYEIDGNYKVEGGKLVFSAPVPVKMESRADLMKKRKALKIVA